MNRVKPIESNQWSRINRVKKLENLRGLIINKFHEVFLLETMEIECFGPLNKFNKLIKMHDKNSKMNIYAKHLNQYNM